MKVSMSESEQDRQLSRELAVYQRLSDRYQSHVTIMWQAPALGLAAEAFLMTVSLNSTLSRDARVIAAALGACVALMSVQLMSKHRSISGRDERALSHLEAKLGISSPFKDIPLPGSRWATRVSSYLVWRIGLVLFALTNIGLLILLALSVKV
jgi:hypothetical protein